MGASKMTGKAIAAVIVTMALLLAAVPGEASVKSQAEYARGLMAFNQGQWDKALESFDKAVQADPNDAWSVYYRGLTQGKRGAAAAAVADIERALALDPKLPHAALDLGIAQLDAGQIEAAYDSLQRAYLQGSERHVTALYLGVAAYRLNENAEATKYLNEAQADPEVRASARYYNALALIRQRHGEAARDELAALAQEAPESEMARAARPYLAEEGETSLSEITATAPWSVNAIARLEYDSNVVAGPSSAPPQPNGLPGNVKGKGDGRFVLGVGGQYRLVDNEQWSLALGGDINSSIHFSLRQFDLLGLPLWMQVASQWGEVRYGVVGEYHYYLLDYESFYQQGMVTPWVSFPEAEGLTGEVYYTFRGRDFFDEPFETKGRGFNPGRDGINHAIGLRQRLELEELGLTLSGGLQYDKEDTISNGPMGRDFQYNGYQLDLGGRYALTEAIRFDASYLLRLEDYDHPNSLAGAPNASARFRRHDNVHFLMLGGEYDLTENVALTAAFLAVINGSNIPNFDYDRFILSPGVRVSF